MREQNVEKLFKDTFSNFEADVNPSAWANIQQSLPSSPQNVPAKPSGFFGKMYLSTIALVVVISAAITGTVLYLSSEKSVSKDVAQNVQTQTQPSQVTVSLGAPPAIDAAPVSAQQKNTEAVKQAADKAKEKVMLNEPVKQTPAQTKSEKTNSDNAVQVATENNPTTQPTASQQNGTNAGKVLVPSQSTQQTVDKSYTPPSTETLPGASAGPSATVLPLEVQMDPAEYKEEFHFYIPNVFTPNGDMVNDYFTPIGNHDIKDYELVIYDRYGFEIFRTNDITVWWDGKLKNGDMAAVAVYVYTIKLTDFKDEAHDYIGYVALLK